MIAVTTSLCWLLHTAVRTCVYTFLRRMDKLKHNVVKINVTWLWYAHVLYSNTQTHWQLKCGREQRYMINIHTRTSEGKQNVCQLRYINVNLVILWRGCFMNNPTFYLNLCGADAIGIGQFWPISCSLEDLMQTHKDTRWLLQPWHILFTTYLTHVRSCHANCLQVQLWDLDARLLPLS